MLTQLSQRSNTKLRDVAARIVEARTGYRPTLDDPATAANGDGVTALTDDS